MGQHSARSRHSGTGWIEPLPLLDPLAQSEPDFQFDQAVGCDATPVPTVKPLHQLCQLAPGELFNEDKHCAIPVQGARDRYDYNDATMRRAFPMQAMDSTHPIRDAILLVESLFICHAAFLKRVPLLRLLYRTVTADLRVLPPQDRVAAGFRVEFRSPYFHIPVSVDKSQIGQVKRGQWLEPGAFRLFDWQTCVHIDGNVEWHGGERRTLSKGQQLDLITGFSYRVPELPEGIGNLGLKLAEGV